MAYRWLIVIAVLLCASVASATSYFYVRSATTGNQFFVDNSGSPPCNDGNPGTNSGAPWCTLAHVASVQSAFVADSHINLRGGDTWNEQLDITNMHGTPGHPIVLGAYGTGRAIINGQGVRSYCVDSLSGTRHDLTISGIECTQFTLQGITFQGTGGAGGYAPGITYLNDYVHDGGPGKFSGATVGPDSHGYCVAVGTHSGTDCNGNAYSGTFTAGACDDCGYTNALDFDDFGSGLGIDSVHMIGNTVQNVGGHNCLQVHYDGGDSLVQGNTVGPGCNHNAIDIKGSGTLGSHTATADSNIITTGTNSTFTAANASACMYDENTFNAASSVLWTRNVCYTAAGTLGNYGYQEANDGSCTHANCTQNITLYNNTIKVTNGLTFQKCFAVGGSGNNADQTFIAKNNICEGGTASASAGVNLTWDFNDDGGHQGKSSSYSGISTGAHDLVNIDPGYVNFAGNNYLLALPTSPVATAGQPFLVDSLTAMGYVNAPGSTNVVKANDFLDTLGVATHIVQGADNPTLDATALTYLGVRHVREDATHNSALITTLIGVHNSTGVTFDQLPIVDADPNDIADSLAQYEQMKAGGALLATEGPNEPNNFPFTYQGINSASNYAAVSNFQKDLDAAVKADSNLAGIPVFDTTETGSETSNVGLQFLVVPAGSGTLVPTGTVYADYANLHNYVQFNGEATPEDNQSWWAEWPGAASGSDGPFANYGVTWRNGYTGYTIPQLTVLPKLTTETGWVTTGTNSVSEDKQGKLLTNVYLSAVKLGWKYTFIYLLHDDGNGFGLLHTDYTNKLSATYIHNLTTILADTSSAFTPTLVNYTVVGEPDTGHDLLMQKSNGTFELAVWGDAVSASTPVTVNLGATYSTVKVYDITVGTSPISTISSTATVPLTLTDHAFIVEFGP